MTSTSVKNGVSAVWDIAAKLFGTTSTTGGGGASGGDMRGPASWGGVGGGRGADSGLATFTVDVHTDGSAKLGIGVKELGGGAVVVQVRSALCSV